ncbi:Uncharacterised protein [Legionella donaldsonii]|uniref:Uncharacterized protein n=1 Tax=Legionella donaldsonii TaxID=45060 RepID=A0A378KI40_9GAMM|nr:hypothetical protein [Legionella donaldsonii]STX84010.1 Uncharacterised protein [Legionella donaldsonii]
MAWWNFSGDVTNQVIKPVNTTQRKRQNPSKRFSNLIPHPQIVKADLPAAEALGNKLEDFIDISAENIKESNYIAVISTSNLTEPDQTKVLGFY